MDEMKTAIKGATTWLLKVAKNTNPIPYGLFKTSIDRRIVWASERGENLDFDTLAEEVKKGLAYQGVQIMPNKYAKKKELSLAEYVSDDFLLDSSDTFTLRPNDGLSQLFSWLYSVFEKAEREQLKEICFKTSIKEGDA